MPEGRPRARLFYGWYIVAAGWGVHVMVAATYVLGMGVFFNPIRAEMGWNAASTALAFSLRQFEAGFLSPVVGFLIDRVGTRKMMFVGLSILGLGFLLLGRVQNLWQFYVAFLFLAIGPSVGYAQAMNAALVNWFRRRRVRAMGLMWTGGSIGSLLVPAIALLLGAIGWRWTAAACGVAIWLVCLPLAAVMRHRPEPYGWSPDGDAAPEGQPRPAGSAGAGPGQGEPEISVRGALELRVFWVIAVAQAAFAMASSMVLTVNLVPFLESIDVPRTQASSMITVFMMAALPARLSLGWIGDRFEKRHMLALLYAMSASGIAILAMSQSYWQAVPFALLAGFAHGGVVILTATLVSESFGTRRFASINGLLQTFGVLGGVAGPFAGGLVFDVVGTYRPAFLFVSAVVALASPIILTARPPAGVSLPPAEPSSQSPVAGAGGRR